jgi:hypothetical protein
MLIEYSVENFRSVSERTTLSILTSKERRNITLLNFIRNNPGLHLVPSVFLRYIIRINIYTNHPQTDNYPELKSEHPELKSEHPE